MKLSQVLFPDNSASNAEKIVNYLLDKVVIAILVAVVVCGFQHFVEANDAKLQMERIKNEKVAQVINGYSSEIMQMSTNHDEVDGPLSSESLWSDYDIAKNAIDKLLIQQSLNVKAFEPYSDEIEDCERAVTDYYIFIQEVLCGDFGTQGTLEEYEKALKEHHTSIQLACVALSNHSSNVLYGCE